MTWKAIRSTGGFVEGFVYLTPMLHSHTGYGVDDPDDDDITAIPNTLFGRTYNSTFCSNLLWDLDKTFRIAFEATYRQTEYKEPTNLPNEGFGFHTQFAWTFLHLHQPRTFLPIDQRGSRSSCAPSPLIQ